MVLVANPRLDSRKEPGPNAAGAERREGMPAAIPLVEVADNGDVIRVRCPDREVIARHAAHRGRVGAELIVEPEVTPLVEEIKVLRP